MSTCSFSSYLQMRAAAAFSGPAAIPDAAAGASGPTSALASVAVPHHHPHPFDHVAPSPSLSDAGSPFKRQRNRSPDSSNVAGAVASALPTPAATDDGHMSANAVAAASSYFAAFHASHHHFQQHHAPPMSGLDPPTPSSSSSPAHSPLVAPVPKSILCIPSSPLSTVSSSPFTSPPVSRPVSRRSSTSKSVRFARCTNASVFPTHSTEEYDRSPIVPTCESESLEIKRCKSEDEEEGWIMCQARLAAADKASAAAAAAKLDGDKPQVPRLPKHSPAMENPVEGVHGLIEGGFFVGDDRDRLGGSTPSCGAAGLLPEVVPEEEEDEGDELDLNPLEGALNDEDLDVDLNVEVNGERMLIDDAPEDLDVEHELHLERRRSLSPAESVASSSSALSAASSLADGDDTLVASRPSREGARDESPPSTASNSSHDGDSSSTATGPASSTELSSSAGSVASETIAAAAPKKKRFGLCGIGKYTRQDIFSSHDSLGGF